ncbi:acyl-CoA synthetase [Pseudonocardia halophobica]|uniref:Acyl-CoA synthetase n=1 Tax=Pseudonocardia halophobica TaxID=29401 RepID=A0A9W6KZH5_9PSEU|nr:AMP-binding protein [Pseudonocardia halophobica]GLL09439.1 acyl-CoA synthetase [Pseudonocardia halophobica]
MPERTLVRRRVRGPADVADIERHDPADLRPADTVLGCLRAVAAEQPGKQAVVLVEPPDLLTPARSLDYAGLVAGVEGTADLFREVGGADSVVGLLLPMLPEGLVALWGAQTAGIAVPINPFLELPAITGILDRTHATAVVTTRKVLEEKGGAQALHQAVPSLRRVFTVEDLIAARDRSLTFTPDPDPDRDSLVMPTGGTTGTPKLVRMSQGGQLTVAWNVGALMGNEPDTVTLHGMPNFHCGGTISLGLRTLLFGGTLLTLTSEGFRSRQAVTAFWDVARRYRVTSLLATPTTATALLHGQGDADGCCIRDFHVGGAPLSTDVLERFHARFGIWLRENWGMTELHGTTTGHFDDGRRPRVGSAGRALPFVRVKAVELDADGGWVRDCDPGERGVLLTGTPTTMAGYLDPSLDADYFPTGLPDDLPAGWRWGNTGDLGTVDGDGFVWIFGRAKDLIIRGGHNIDPGEIEDALVRHPAVHLAAAIGRPDPVKGELPMAYVQLREDEAAEPADLLGHCRTHIGERAAVPVEVVVLERMPTTPVGKISKPALRREALLREVRRVVRKHVPDGTVLLDETGPRQRVVITVADSAAAEALRVPLSGYPFEVSLVVARSERPTRPTPVAHRPAPLITGSP